MSNNAKALLQKAGSAFGISEKGGVYVVTSDLLSQRGGVKHGFSTRPGGVSAPPFDSLNLGTTRPEPWENIMENYRRFSAACGVEFSELTLVRHEHGTNILRLDAKDAGRGITREPFGFCDGFVTNDPGVTLVTAHADCSAFFLYDERTRSIGLAHAGWKGMFGRIGQKLVERLNKEYGADPKDIVAAVGPCICENCFEVDLSLAESFAREFDCPDIFFEKPTAPGKGFVSLRAAAVIQLMDAGVPIENISVIPLCTYERSDLFFSYRRDGKGTGSMAAFMKLV